MRNSYSDSGLTAKRSNRLLSAGLIALAIFFSSCKSDMVYSRFAPILSGEWHMDSVLQFTYSIPDTTPDYRLTLYVRHAENYPYQNIWLFAGDSARCDTINCFLADDRGRWLGDKHHGWIETPVFIGENFRYTDTGTYTLTVQHAMRDTVLRGVWDVGVEISKYGKK